MEILFVFHFPFTQELIQFKVERTDLLTGRDIKYLVHRKAIESNLFGFQFDKFILLHHYKEVISEEIFSLSELDIIEHFFFIFSISSPFTTHTEFQEFILDSTHKNFQTNVSVTTTPMILFCPNYLKLSLHAQSFLDHSIVRSSTTYQSWQDMPMFLGKELAKKYGYQRWCQSTYPQRVFLIELIPELNPFLPPNSPAKVTHKLNQIRYDVNGVNKGYTGGDLHSWQRYTSSLPLDVRLVLNRSFPIPKQLLQEHYKKTEMESDSSFSFSSVSSSTPAAPVSSQSISSPFAEFFQQMDPATSSICFPSTLDSYTFTSSHTSPPTNTNNINNNNNTNPPPPLPPPPPPPPLSFVGTTIDDFDFCVSLTLVPDSPLRPLTTYAILLSNGIPVIPENLSEARYDFFLSPGICQDHLIIFQTEDIEISAPTINNNNSIVNTLPPPSSTTTSKTDKKMENKK